MAHLTFMMASFFTCGVVLVNAAVVCNDTAAMGAVRLVNSSNAGTVEVCWEGVWTPLLESSVRTREANAICRELGYQPEGAEILKGDECVSGDLGVCTWSEGGDIENCSTVLVNCSWPSTNNCTIFWRIAKIRCSFKLSWLTPEILTLMIALPLLVSIVVIYTLLLIYLTRKLARKNQFQPSSRIPAHEMVTTSKCVAYEACDPFEESNIQDSTFKSGHHSSRHTFTAEQPDKDMFGSQMFLSLGCNISSSDAFDLPSKWRSMNDIPPAKKKKKKISIEEGKKTSEKKTLPSSVSESLVPVLPVRSFTKHKAGKEVLLRGMKAPSHQEIISRSMNTLYRPAATQEDSHDDFETALPRVKSHTYMLDSDYY